MCTDPDNDDANEGRADLNDNVTTIELRTDTINNDAAVKEVCALIPVQFISV